MTERDQLTQRERSGKARGLPADEGHGSDIDRNSSGTGGRTIDDRRRPVKPTDNPVPSSPRPEESAVREGEEKLARVKPY